MLAACQNESTTRFRYVSSSDTGITFENTIIESDRFNILNFHYIYNGGGVGVGDFDKNGFPDLVFTGNQVDSKLYLNDGSFSFRDVTEQAQFKTTGWNTGVSIVDINADGWEDIYISVGGLNCKGNCQNQLFIHQGFTTEGIPFFKESATEYGLLDGLYTQQAAFFDYDLDGDLDVYLLRNIMDARDKNVPAPKRYLPQKSADALLENIGTKEQPFFKEVSDSLNIDHRGYGLGIAINDFNADGRPDIYIANDFLSDDILYLNTPNEGFKEISQSVLKHTSYNAMGVDVADLNADGLPEILVLDMLPETHERQKRTTGFMNYNKYLLALKEGYTPQYIRNTLQIHNGFLNGQLLPFSELGYMTGIYNTDWSWAPLLADFDNDGDRDIYITNGYGKDITDLDFINYSNQQMGFGTKEAQRETLWKMIQEMPDNKMPDYLFENEGLLRFKNQVSNWLPEKKSISNGAVYVDLDQDGDLDLVTNTINEPAFVLENQTIKQELKKNNYIKINLSSTTNNTAAIGATVEVITGKKRQTAYHSRIRGYLSSMGNSIHFGLGDTGIVDTIRVSWPNNKQESILINVAVNQTISISDKEAVVKEKIKEQKVATVLRKDTLMSHVLGVHQEDHYQDFNSQPLLMQQLSRQGPCMVSANIDRKEGDELFIGGAKGQASKLCFEKEGNLDCQSFSSTIGEVQDAVFFDVDGDEDQDLYVVFGGAALPFSKTNYQDHIYLNNGFGNFDNTNFKVSPAISSSSCVRAHDFDKDGDIDLFVGGRVVPQKYPTTPESYLLQNDEGGFSDITKRVAPALREIGMVTDASWVDYDGDGWQDLIVVGEWMPITIFKNNNGQLQNPFTIPYSNGLWTVISTADFDKDGDQDFILGNQGWNTKLQASITEPITIIAEDIDQNGSPDPLIGQYYKNRKGQRQLYPIHARDDVVRQLVQVKGQFRSYAAFAEATFDELIPSSNIEQLIVDNLSSSYLENKGNGEFELRALPQVAQIAPIQDILTYDLNKDGHLDILAIGNDYSAESNGGRHDAMNGIVLLGNSKGDFVELPTSKSGFFVPGDGRAISLFINGKGERKIVVGQNSGAFEVFY